MKILLGMPCVGNIPTKTVICLLQTIKKDAVEPLIIQGSLVYDARDTIARFAVDNGYDYVLYVDSDMMFGEEDIQRLFTHDVGICSGLYTTRNGENQNVAYNKVVTRRQFPFRAPKLIPDGARSGYGEIRAVGFGFCLIKTSVLKRMFKHYKSLFEPFKGVGEDIAFCLRARRLGIKIYIDRDVKLGHIGQTIYGM